jgi:hypothetical protein
MKASIARPPAARLAALQRSLSLPAAAAAALPPPRHLGMSPGAAANPGC